jgi:hypothetical protein
MKPQEGKQHSAYLGNETMSNDDDSNDDYSCPILTKQSWAYTNDDRDDDCEKGEETREEQEQGDKQMAYLGGNNDDENDCEALETNGQGNKQMANLGNKAQEQGDRHTACLDEDNDNSWL